MLDVLEWFQFNYLFRIFNLFYNSGWTNEIIVIEKVFYSTLFIVSRFFFKYKSHLKIFLSSKTVMNQIDQFIKLKFQYFF